jgi:hypothetical protein
MSASRGSEDRISIREGSRSGDLPKASSKASHLEHTLKSNTNSGEGIEGKEPLENIHRIESLFEKLNGLQSQYQ